MPPSEPTRHEPCPLGVAAMPTIGALSESAPIVAAGIDCAAIFADDACAAACAFAAAFRCVAAAAGFALPAPADVTAVTTAVSVTNEIAVYAISWTCVASVPRSTSPLHWSGVAPTGKIGTLAVGVER